MIVTTNLTLTELQNPADRAHRGNTILTVNGYFKRNASETAADKMAKVLKAEGALRAIV